jgi:DNA-binding transcriptional MerR regulator
MEPQQEEGYISVKEAAKRIDYSLRQTDRFIKAGKLEAVHYSRSLRKVSVASVDAFIREIGRRPVDPLQQVREQLGTQEQVAGDILRQLAVLRQQLTEQHAALQRRCADLEGQVRLLKAELQQEQEARQTLEQLMAALAAGSGGQDLAPLLQSLALRPTSSRRLPPFARRGYPPGTVRLAPFAERHGVEPSTLRRQAEKSPELATIYERPTARVNKREWWLLPEQQPLVIAYWQAQGIPYTPCLDCPHGGNMTGEQEQSPVEEVKTT